jgi:hypothetical protein
MATKSRIVVEFEGNEYGVVLPIEGLFVDKVKKIIVEELKSTRPNIFGPLSIDIDYLTLYSDEGKTVQNTDKKKPVGEEFYFIATSLP